FRSIVNGLRYLALHAFTGQRTSLTDPIEKLCLVEPRIVNMEIAYVSRLRRFGWRRIQQRALEKRDLDVFGIAVQADKPSVAFVAIEGRIPLHRLRHIRDGFFNQCIDTLPYCPLPAGHRVNIGLHWLITVTLRDLRVAAGKQP